MSGVQSPAPVQWGMVPGTLPIAPAMVLKRDTGLHMIYGAIRGPRNGPNLWVVYGCNLHTIPEFCGGLYLTSANSVVHEFNPSYADTTQRQMWNQMRSTDDLFDWAEFAPRLLALPPAPWSRWESGRITGQRQEVGTALERLGAVSMGARLMSAAVSYRRNAINFWDTRNGSTRYMMKWLFTALSGGVAAPDSYNFLSGSHSELSERRSPRLDSIPNGDGLDFRHFAYPTKFVTGQFFRNANSGNTVACSTIIVRDGRPPQFVPNVERSVSLQRIRQLPSLFRTETLGLGAYAVPARFYPM